MSIIYLCQLQVKWHKSNEDVSFAHWNGRGPQDNAVADNRLQPVDIKYEGNSVYFGNILHPATERNVQWCLF